MELTDKAIGKYDLTALLGRGGMGEVWLAEDKRIGRQVAIKTLKADSGQPDALERFYREAKAGFLQHPNIVTLYDLGDQDGTPFIVMEYVKGDTLENLLRGGGQLRLLDKLTIIDQVCSALGYAHQHGVIHRDIKPLNVIVQRSPLHAKVIDFGIARARDSIGASDLTRTGEVIGTVEYISPERLRGQAYDARCDIYATGVMLYRLITGRLPYEGDEPAVVAVKSISEPFPPLSKYVESYPAALDAVMEKCLAKDPAARYSTAEEFSADLQSIIDELNQAHVAELFEDAERLAVQQQFGRARELLLNLVKIDPQNTSARKLLSLVNTNLQQQQRAEQIRERMAQADEAIAASRFGDAVLVLEDALKLDPGSETLKSRLEAVQRKKRQQDEVNGLLSQAGVLSDRGDWTGALNVLEKAIRIDEQDTRARSIYAEVSRHAKLAAQQQQVRELMTQARQELAVQRFTAAIDVLREVSTIDPSIAEAETLLQTAVAGQELQRRRTLIEQIEAEIAKCMDHEDWERANNLVDRALERIPSEPSLLQIKTRVTVEINKQRLRSRVDEAASAAQAASVDSPAEALLIVQRAIQELGREARLVALEQSLLQRLKSAEKDEVRARFLRDAEGAIHRGEFEKAIEFLETYQIEFDDPAGAAALLQIAKDELARKQMADRVAACLTQAKTLLQQQKFTDAIKILEAASAETGDASLNFLLQEAIGQQKETVRKLEAVLNRVSRMRERGQFADAIAALSEVQANVAASPQLSSLLDELRREEKRKQDFEAAKALSSQALQESNFQKALDALQRVQRAWGDSPELSKAIAEIEANRTQFAEQALEQALQSARTALLANDQAGARSQLEAVAGLFEFAGAAQQADWKRLSTEAAKPATGRVARVPVMETAEAPAAPRRKLLIGAIAGAVLVVAAVVAFLLVSRSHAPQPKVPVTSANQPASGVPAPPGSVPSPGPEAAPAVFGTLLVQGNVEGADVLVDGISKAFTGHDKSATLRLDPGKDHRITVVKPGFKDSEPIAVKVAANTQHTIRFTLSPSGAPPPPETMGYLSIHSTPQAAVVMDGAPAGTIDSQGGLILPMKPGSHNLDLSLAGYQSWSQKGIGIKAGDHPDIYAQLPRIQVKTQPVQISSFYPSAQTVESDHPVTLLWTTANAAEVTLEGSQGPIKVDGSGQKDFTPTPPATTYTLVARGNDGSTQSKQITIQVNVPSSAVKQTAAPPTNTPAAVDPSEIKQTVSSYVDAFNAHNLAKMRSIWTSMPPTLANSYSGIFSNYPKARILSEDCSWSALAISGDSASLVCTETIGGSGLARSLKQTWQCSFAKRNGNWIMADRKGQ